MKLARLWAVLPMWAAAAGGALGHQDACQQGCPAGEAQPTIYACEAAFYENHVWPRQYSGPARRGICHAAEMMTVNGWRRHNLLGKHHFEPNGEQLNEAGRLKTEWILTQAPPSRRTVYVQRSASPDQTAGRIDAVQQFAAEMPQSGGGADVQETHVRDDGYPAGAVDAVFTGFQASRPAPALPSAGGESSSSGGSAE